MFIKGEIKVQISTEKNTKGGSGMGGKKLGLPLQSDFSLSGHIGFCVLSIELWQIFKKGQEDG